MKMQVFLLIIILISLLLVFSLHKGKRKLMDCVYEKKISQQELLFLSRCIPLGTHYDDVITSLERHKDIDFFIEISNSSCPKSIYFRGSKVYFEECKVIKVEVEI